MASAGIADGNVRGLLAFMDFMVEKGYGSAAAIGPWKSAARQVFERVEGEGFEEADVRSLDIDEYIDRFENRSHGKYSANSLRAYRGRFRKAVEAYRSYLADPNWRPSLRASSRTSAVNGVAEKPTRGRSRTAEKPRDEQTALVPVATSSLIAYPFPLKSGQIAQLHLPTQLEHEDAERLIQFVRALVFDQPRQLAAGESDDAG
jgi:hypothetical protein